MNPPAWCQAWGHGLKPCMGVGWSLNLPNSHLCPHEDKHLTNLRGPTGRLQVIQEEDHTSPGWKQVAQHNGFWMASWTSNFQLHTFTGCNSCASNICSDWRPLKTGQIFLHKFWFHGTSQALAVGFFARELMHPCFRIYNFKSCGPSCYPPQIPSWANVSNMIAGHAKIQCWLVANFVDKSRHSVWQRKQFSGFCKISFTVFKELSKGVTPIWLSSSAENRREHQSRPCIKLPFLCWLRSEFAQVRVYKIWRSIWLRFCLFDGWQNYSMTMCHEFY